MATRLTQSELITQRLTPRLGLLQRIQAWNHPGRHTSSTTVKFPYGNWLADPAPIYRKNGTIITPTSTDTDDGTATITGLDAGDDVTADYSFKYFTTTDLGYFYDLAVSKLNNTAPASSFDYTSYPIDTEDFLTKYAYKVALERVITDTLMWESALIWVDRNQLVSFLMSVLSTLNAELTGELANVKGRRFTMPRSVASGKYRTPSMVNEATWTNYTVIRS